MIRRVKSTIQLLCDAWQNRAQLDGQQRSLDELDFLPAALEIQERPASKSARMLGWSLVSLFTISVIWACIGQVNVVAVAEGKIIPTTGVKQIQPLEKGVVKQIFVREGEVVSKGQALIELDQTLTRSDQERLVAELNFAKENLARYRAMSEVLAYLAPSTTSTLQLTVADLLRLPALQTLPHSEKVIQAKLLQHEFHEIQSQIAALQSQLNSRVAEQSVSAATIQKLKATLPLITRRANAAKAMLDKNLTPETQFLELESMRIEQQQDLAAQQARQVQLSAMIDEVKHQISALTAQASARTLTLIDDSERQVYSLTKELNKARDLNAKQVLYAPVDGRVQQLSVHTVGGVVTPAQALMVVVPDDDYLEVDAVIENKDIGFIRVGQSAEIKVHTFPFTKYGVVEAQVIGITADAIADERQGLVYKMRLKMHSKQLFINGQWIDLLPGMAVSAEVQTSKRRLIEYVTAPLLRYQNESVRER
ncbi:HlyD family type I secretion periplasmic adaptor subunit [Pseudoalteromonas umbrosa]|uniref:HlyD family type I secretion periplasmic adaptor subunit n=1 Tax=Pseudoalteromonas umbrosa TaxID=3048489 RepID=UPI0024C21392|nr:HlyD family type I secretion periplasmic adaptor subunit [Pseudoalteromonas sp. B95]MDK1290342.1 HlyD family type I secretion periplasmic adaptor subunit [Pseudoalteromonas sp. B95]